MATSEDRAQRVIDFIQKFCVVPEGKLVGCLIQLEPFQQKFIREIYSNPSGTRRAYLSLARKNGKTALIACLVLAHLVGPEAVVNSQIVSGARSREQAGIVFKLAQKIVALSPSLRPLVRVIPSNKTLIGIPRNVEYRAIAAEGSTAHGLSPVLAILDEVGQIKGPQDDFVDAIETSQGAHDAPLLIAISTQAATDAALFSVWLDDAEASGDPTIVSHVYAAPDGCDLSDRAAWRAANPALGTFRSEADVAAQAADAARMPAKEATFRNLILNMRVNTFAPFVSPRVWKEANGAPSDDAFAGVVFGGLDLSATTDLTAFVLLARDANGVAHVRPFFWMPAEAVADASKRDRAPYDVWVRQGLLRTTPGQVIDYDFVARDIGSIIAPLNIGKVGFDRWRIDRLKAALDRQEVKIELEPVGQGVASMTPALDLLEQDLLGGTLRHGGHPVLAMCAANAVEVRDSADNRKLDKHKATGRIDGMVALAMAELVAGRPEPTKKQKPKLMIFA